MIIIAAGTQVVAKPNQQPFFYFLADKNHYLPYASINGVNEILLKSTLTIQPKDQTAQRELEERKLEEKMTMEIILSWKISNYWIHQIGQITTSELLLVHFDVNTPWLPSHKHEAECCCRRFQVFPIISNVVDGFVGQR